MAPTAVLPRFRRLANVALHTRDLAFALRSARRHELFAIEGFLRQGGRIERRTASLDGIRLPIDAAVLAAAAALKEAGLPMTRRADRYVIGTSAMGLFELPAVHLANGLLTLAGLYVMDEYAGLDVSGATVIDVGAHIGDSAVYFYKRGARLVHAYEPFRPLYEVALQNVYLNGASGIIRIFDVGIGAEAAEFDVPFDVDDSWAASTVFRANVTPGTRLERVTVIPFAEIVDRAVQASAGSRIVCKLDCEGAEFGALLSDRSVAALTVLTELFVETHYEPPDAIERRLRATGFETTVSQINRRFHLIRAKKSKH